MPIGIGQLGVSSSKRKSVGQIAGVAISDRRRGREDLKGQFDAARR